MTRTLQQLIIAAGVCAATLLATAHKAEARELTGTQLSLYLQGEKSLDDSPFGVHVWASKFWMPDADADITFAYAGPTLTLKDDDATLWVGLHAVAALGFLESDAFGPSLWAGYRNGIFGAFAEVDRYDAIDGGHAWYGFYAGNWLPNDWLKLGLHVEHVDDALHAGPHVGITTGPYSAELQYHYGVANDQTNGLRLSTGLSF